MFPWCPPFQPKEVFHISCCAQHLYPTKYDIVLQTVKTKSYSTCFGNRIKANKNMVGTNKPTNQPVSQDSRQLLYVCHLMVFCSVLTSSDLIPPHTNQQPLPYAKIVWLHASTCVWVSEWILVLHVGLFPSGIYNIYQVIV